MQGGRPGSDSGPAFSCRGGCARFPARAFPPIRRLNSLYKPREDAILSALRGFSAIVIPEPSYKAVTVRGVPLKPVEGRVAEESSPARFFTETETERARVFLSRVLSR